MIGTRGGGPAGIAHMKLRSLLTYTLLLAALGTVAVTWSVLMPAGKAAGQPEPTMVITPSSGPCDAAVEITGRDFPPSTAIRLDIGGPGQSRAGSLVGLMTDSNGRFGVNVVLGQLGCEAARLIEELGVGPDEIWIIADLEERVIEPGRGIPPILTRTPYTYTTTDAALQAAPVVLPRTGSGPDVTSVLPAPFLMIGVVATVGLVVTLASFAYRRRR